MKELKLTWTSATGCSSTSLLLIASSSDIRERKEGNEEIFMLMNGVNEPGYR
jgi:hypothetical protein